MRGAAGKQGTLSYCCPSGAPFARTPPPPPRGGGRRAVGPPERDEIIGNFMACAPLLSLDSILSLAHSLPLSLACAPSLQPPPVAAPGPAVAGPSSLSAAAPLAGLPRLRCSRRRRAGAPRRSPRLTRMRSVSRSSGTPPQTPAFLIFHPSSCCAPQPDRYSSAFRRGLAGVSDPGLTSGSSSPLSLSSAPPMLLLIARPCLLSCNSPPPRAPSCYAASRVSSPP